MASNSHQIRFRICFFQFPDHIVGFAETISFLIRYTQTTELFSKVEGPLVSLKEAMNRFAK